MHSRSELTVRMLGYYYRVTADAFARFNADDGWAIASHIALSGLMSLFPFLIVVTAFAGFIGTKNLADEVAQILLEAWPTQVAEPLAAEVHSVLTTSRGDLLTIGSALAIYFSSSGIESLRIGLNRAYGVVEARTWWVLRLESIAYVLVAATVLLVLAFLVVLAPLLFGASLRYAPWLSTLWPMFNFLRLAVATTVFAVALVIVHKWLPAGHRPLLAIAPGAVVTMALWLVAGELFGDYLARFAYTYVTYYAGLASAMIALVFLYLTASIFIFGGELNAALARAKEAEQAKKAEQEKAEG